MYDVSIPQELYYCPQCKTTVKISYYNSPLLQKEFKCCKRCRSIEIIEFKRRGKK
jgi:hypothetical protein